MPSATDRSDPLRNLSFLPDDDPFRQNQAFLESLGRIRSAIRLALDQFEARLRTRLASGNRLPEDLGEEYHRLSEERRQFESEMEQRTKEWNELMEQLQQERTALAQAWENLERERTEALAAGSLSHLPTSNERIDAAVRVAARTSSESDETIARALLRQFEALRHDVRIRTNRHSMK